MLLLNWAFTVISEKNSDIYTGFCKMTASSSSTPPPFAVSPRYSIWLSHLGGSLNFLAKIRTKQHSEMLQNKGPFTARTADQTNTLHCLESQLFSWYLFSLLQIKPCKIFNLHFHIFLTYCPCPDLTWLNWFPWKSKHSTCTRYVTMHQSASVKDL